MSGYTLGADLEIHVSVRSEECTIDRVELQKVGSHYLHLHPALKGLVDCCHRRLRLTFDALVDFVKDDGLDRSTKL
jgi:hypothetical protein